jgi:hypothetical protein
MSFLLSAPARKEKPRKKTKEEAGIQLKRARGRDTKREEKKKKNMLRVFEGFTERRRSTRVAASAAASAAVVV